MDKKILVLGAGFLQQFIIKRAHELGYYVLAVDGDTNAVGYKYADQHDIISITDQAACLDYAIKNNVDGVITAATEHAVIPCAYIAEKMQLPGNSVEVAKQLKNKYLVRKRLIDNEIDDVKQCFEVDCNTNISEIDVSFPVIVKPCEGSGSRGISKVNSRAELTEACNAAVAASSSGTAEIEDFVEGSEYGIESFVYNGEITVLAVSKKHMTKAPYYAELGHNIPNDLTAEVEARAKNIAKRAIKALGINIGGVNMDILIDKHDSIYIVDIGMRMGGNLIGSHLIPIGTGVDYMGNIIRTAVGDAPVWDTTVKRCVSTKLLALEPGIVEKLPDVSYLEKKYNVDILHHIKCGDEIRLYKNNLDGCGYIVAVAADINTALKNSERAKDEFDKSIVRKL